MSARTKADRLAAAWFMLGCPGTFVLLFGAMAALDHQIAQLIFPAAIPVSFIGMTALGYWIDIGRRVMPWLNSDA